MCGMASPSAKPSKGELDYRAEDDFRTLERSAKRSSARA